MPKVSQSYLQARRGQIVEAAEICFARKGLRETTMQDIAQEAGVSYGVLYRYFQSKDALFRAAAEVAEASRDARFQEAGKLGDSIEVLGGAIRLALDRWRDPASSEELRMRLQVLAEAAHDAGFQDFVQDGLATYWSRFADIVRQGQVDGQIDPNLDPSVVAQMLFALQEGFTDQRAITPDLDIDAYQRLLLIVLERALRPPPSGGEVSHGKADGTE